MQALSDTHDNITTSLGQRRGKPDLARFSLDLTWARARADSGSTALSRDYPSPPMSGSPPLPPKAPHEFAERSQGSQGGQGSYQTTTTQDVRHGLPAIQVDSRLQQAGVIAGPPGMPSYSTEAQERVQHAWPRHEASLPRALPYPHQGQGQPLHQHQQQQLSYLPAPGPGPGLGMGSAPPSAYSSLSSTTATTSGPLVDQQREGPIQSSPKLQRKTKGHVASACVPCKRAHLRYVPCTPRSEPPLTVSRCDGMYQAIRQSFCRSFVTSSIRNISRKEPWGR